MASLFHTCFPAEGTLICGKPLREVPGFPFPSKLPSSPTALLVTTHPHIFPAIPPGPCSHVPGLLSAISGMWASVAAKSDCHHTAHMSGEASCLPGAASSLGKAVCALQVARYPHSECLPCPKGGQKEGEVPVAFSAALPNTRHQRQRNLTSSLKVICVYQGVSAWLLASCAGRAPLNPCFW